MHFEAMTAPLPRTRVPPDRRRVSRARVRSSAAAQPCMEQTPARVTLNRIEQRLRNSSSRGAGSNREPSTNTLHVRCRCSSVYCRGRPDGHANPANNCDSRFIFIVLPRLVLLVRGPELRCCFTMIDAGLFFVISTTKTAAVVVRTINDAVKQLRSILNLSVLRCFCYYVADEKLAISDDDRLY